MAFSKRTNRNKKTQFFFSFIFQFYLLLLTKVILQTFYNILFRFQLLFFPTREKWKKFQFVVYTFLCIIFFVLKQNAGNRDLFCYFFMPKSSIFTMVTTRLILYLMLEMKIHKINFFLNYFEKGKGK